MSPTTAAPTRRRPSAPAAAPARKAAPARGSVAAPRTRPRPTVRNAAPTAAPTRTRRPAPSTRRAAPATKRPAPATRRVVPPPAPPRRHPRLRVTLFALAVSVVVITIAGFHAFLAQTQVRLEDLRTRTDVAESRYETFRLENGQLTSPARITGRATELGLAPPAVAPVAIPYVGDVPRRSGASQTLADWAEVKRHLDSSP